MDSESPKAPLAQLCTLLGESADRLFGNGRGSGACAAGGRLAALLPGRGELREQVSAAVDLLSEMPRLVVRLRFGLESGHIISMEEAAELLDAELTAAQREVLAAARGIAASELTVCVKDIRRWEQEGLRELRGLSMPRWD